MTISNRRVPVFHERASERSRTARERLPQSGGSFSIHPLVALDGVCLYVTRSGEAVGSYFGVTTRDAAAVAAVDLLATVTDEEASG